MSKNPIKKLSLLITSFAVACTTVSSIKGFQSKIRESVVSRGYSKNTLDGVKKYQSKCLKLKLGKAREVLIGETDPIILQDDDSKTYGYFKVLCVSLSKSGSYSFKIASANKGGGWGKSFYALPKATIYNSNYIKLYSSIVNGRINEGFFKLEWVGSFALKVPNPGNHFIVLEAYNRFEDFSFNLREPLVRFSTVLPIMIPMRPLDLRSYPTGEFTVTASYLGR